MRPPIFALALIAAALCVPAAAEETTTVWMGDADLRAAFSGKAIDGHYENGREFHEKYMADGKLEYREPERHTTGYWSVQSGTFCTIYDTDPTGGCYRVHRVGANCFEFYFTARTEAEAASPDRRKPDWTARGWLTDAPSTCTEGANV